MKTKLCMRDVLLLVGAVALMAAAWSCGGGGGGGGGSNDLTPATLDQGTAEAVASMMLSTGDISEFSQGLSDGLDRAAAPDVQTSTSVSMWALDRVRDALAAGDVINEGDLDRAGSGDTGTMNCYDDGTIRISGSWDGPNEPSDLCQISNATFTIRLNDCTEYGETMDGRITLTLTGNFCDPTGLSVAFSGFTYNGSEFYMASNDFEMAMTDLQYDLSGDLIGVRTRMDGDIAVDALNMGFDNYVEQMSVSGTTVTVSVNGSLTGGCIDGWVTLTTVEDVLIDQSSDCPHQGHVQIAGAEEVVVDVIFNAGGSVTVGSETFDSCNDLPNSCL